MSSFGSSPIISSKQYYYRVERRTSEDFPILPSYLCFILESDMLPISDAGNLDLEETISTLWKQYHALSNNNKLLPGSKRKAGAPLVLILCASARRCVQLIHRYLSTIQKSCRIAKLFAKHFKLPDQIGYLNSHEIGIAVATPHRLRMLLTEKALDMSEVQLILIDMEQDSKQMTLLELHDTSRQLCELFYFHLSRVIQERRSNSLPFIRIAFMVPSSLEVHDS